MSLHPRESWEGGEQGPPGEGRRTLQVSNQKTGAGFGSSPCCVLQETNTVQGKLHELAGIHQTAGSPPALGLLAQLGYFVTRG